MAFYRGALDCCSGKPDRSYRGDGADRGGGANRGNRIDGSYGI